MSFGRVLGIARIRSEKNGFEQVGNRTWGQRNLGYELYIVPTFSTFSLKI